MKGSGPSTRERSSERSTQAQAIREASLGHLLSVVLSHRRKSVHCVVGG